MRPRRNASLVGETSMAISTAGFELRLLLHLCKGGRGQQNTANPEGPTLSADIKMTPW